MINAKCSYVTILDLRGLVCTSWIIEYTRQMNFKDDLWRMGIVEGYYNNFDVSYYHKSSYILYNKIQKKKNPSTYLKNNDLGTIHF